MKNHLASFRLAAGLLVFGATAARAQFTLLETGGTFRTDATNHAAAATPFARDFFGGSTEYGDPHFISHLNDGLYGNSNSWIGGVQSEVASFEQLIVSAGVIFSAPVNLESFAFGRDNTGAFADRAMDVDRFYHIEYSTSAVSGFDPVNATWIRIGTINAANVASSNPALRKLYSFSPVTDVTAFRIVTQTEGSYFLYHNEDLGEDVFAPVNGSAIDELEVYGPAAAIPEPATIAGLAGFAALGLAATRRRRV